LSEPIGVDRQIIGNSRTELSKHEDDNFKDPITNMIERG